MSPTLDLADAPVAPVPHEAGSAARPTKTERFAWGRTLLFGGLAASLLCWAGFYNGYPILTPDSGNYLRSGAFHVSLWPYRAPGYGAFIKWTMLGTSTWLTIAAQAIIVIYILRLTLARLLETETKYVDQCLLASACVMSVLTSLPWVASELLPDIFAGVLLLSAFLLTFSGGMRRAERVVLALIMTLSIAAHPSLFPISILYAGALLLLRLADRGSWGRLPIKSILVWFLVPIITAGLWTANQYRSMGFGFRISPSANYFLLGRLFGNGMAQDYLRENCPKRPFISCQYLSHLPRGDGEFLFEHPMGRALRTHEDEVKAIVFGAIRANPRRFVIASIRESALQFVALHPGEELHLNILVDYWYDVLLVIPKEFITYRLSRQFLDGLFPLSDQLTRIHIAVFWAGTLACLAFAWTRRSARVNQLLAAAFAFLVINATICGALSGVYQRKQSRVAWIVPFCLILYICCWIKDRRRARALTEAELG